MNVNCEKNEPLRSSCPDSRDSGAVIGIAATTDLTSAASFVGGDMKYNLMICQIGLAEADLLEKVDLVDAVILDYLHCWSVSSKRKTASQDGEEYFWVNFNHLLEELPILGIKEKSRISERFKKFRALGLLKSFQFKDNTLYVRLLCGDIFFQKKRGVLRQTEQGVTPSVTGGVTPDGTAQASNQFKPQTKSNKEEVEYDAQKIKLLIPEQLIASWRDKFKAVNVPAEIAKMEAWLDANPANHKSNYKRFIVNWLTRAQDRAPKVSIEQRTGFQPPEDPLDKADIYTCKKCKRQVKLSKRLYQGSTIKLNGECSECFDKPGE